MRFESSLECENRWWETQWGVEDIPDDQRREMENSERQPLNSWIKKNSILPKDIPPWPGIEPT